MMTWRKSLMIAALCLLPLTARAAQTTVLDTLKLGGTVLTGVNVPGGVPQLDSGNHIPAVNLPALTGDITCAAGSGSCSVTGTLGTSLNGGTR